MVHSRRCRAVRLRLFVPFAGLLAAARRAEVLWFPLDPGDTGARGTVVSQGLRAQRKRKATLQALAGTVGLLVVLMEEVVKLPPSGAFAAFHAIRRGGTRRLLHQQLLAHHTPSTVRGELTFSYMAPLTGRSPNCRDRTRVKFALCIIEADMYATDEPFALSPIAFHGPHSSGPFLTARRYVARKGSFAKRRRKRRRRLMLPRVYFRTMTIIFVRYKIRQLRTWCCILEQRF